MNTIFFAAGASYVFFSPNLSTSLLTKSICEEKNWQDVIKKYRSIVGDKVLVASAEVVEKIIRTILGFYPDANFEQIAEIVDKISSYSLDGLPNHNMVNLFEKTLFSLLRIESNTSLTGLWLQQIPFLLRQIIAETILDLERDCRTHEYDALIKKQREFISYIKDNSVNGISVISTNYDDCVPSSINGLDISMGVRRLDSKYECQVDINDFMNTKNVVYFPHGHLRFQMTNNLAVTVWNDIFVANEKRWNGLKSFSSPGTIDAFPDVFSYNFNTFITTGQTKDSSFNNLPYSIYYQRMAIDFTQSQNIVIVGYSFGDEHFNRLLHAFLLTDPSHHIFIVDYYEGMISMTNEAINPNNILGKIQRVFQQSWLLKKDVTTGKLYPFYEDEVDLLNKRGYGKIFPQITFYKKGYVAFLNEYKDIIDENVL